VIDSPHNTLNARVASDGSVLVIAGAQGRAQANQQDRDVLQMAALKTFSDSRGDVLGMPLIKDCGSKCPDVGH
jgi:hypothetical protein